MRRLTSLLRFARPRRRKTIPRWMRKGLLALTVVGLVAGYFAAVAHLSKNGWVDEQMRSAMAWLSQRGVDQGFYLASLVVYGASQTEEAALSAALDARPGTPIFDLDLGRLQRQAEALPWVHVASVERQLPDRLVVRVLERSPLALHQKDGQLALLDRTGAPIPGTGLAAFTDLPVVTGPGSAAAAPALARVLRTAPALAGRVTGATYLGERRWDVRLDDRVWLRLPERNPEVAWLRLARLDADDNILRRNILAIDMRDARQWAFRLAPGERARLGFGAPGS